MVVGINRNSLLLVHTLLRVPWRSRDSRNCELLYFLYAVYAEEKYRKKNKFPKEFQWCWGGVCSLESSACLEPTVRGLGCECVS